MADIYVKDGKVIYEMSAEEARDIGQAVQDEWPHPDLAWYDGKALMDAADLIDFIDSDS